MNELFTGRVGPMGPATVTRAGKRWNILAIGLSSVNCTLARTFTDAGGPLRRVQPR